MISRWFLISLALFTLFISSTVFVFSAPEPRAVRHRSPIDIAVLADGRRALTANHTSESVSLVDLVGGKVLAEHSCGHRPAGVACSRDGGRAVVSNLWSGTLTLWTLSEEKLEPAGEVNVGYLPRGLEF